MTTTRQDAFDAYDYARWIGTPAPTEADIDLFIEMAGGDVLAITQEERDQIVYDIINAK
jgi:hypothetical protein